MGCVVMCAISSVGEAGREGTCGGGRLLAGLVYFTVDVILVRDTGTLGRGRWFGTAAMFGLMGGCRHCETGRRVHTGICWANRAWFSLLVWGLSKCVCIDTFNY